MDETYIIIEEDNERKILLEGRETKEAHRETEKRYRHLVEPVAAGIDLEAIRRQFMKPAPENRPEPEAEAEVKETPESSPQTGESSAPSEPAPEKPSPRPIEEQVRDLIEKYKAQRPAVVQEEIHPAEPLPTPEAEETPAEPEEEEEIRYTVLNESDVEILTSDDLPPQTDRGTVYVRPSEPRKTRVFTLPSILAAAGVAVVCLLSIYLIWSI